MHRARRLMLYALTHFWMDLSCAFLMFRTLSDGGDPALCLLFYNFCAFALQMPLGLMADRLDRNGLVAAGGCLVTALAYLCPLPLAAAVTAGVGNALFHLGGGIDVLNGSRKKGAALGIFVAPGALGLFIGTLWGKGAAPALWFGPAGLVLLAMGLFAAAGGPSGNAPFDPTPVRSCAPLVPLFLVVVLRSYMGLNQSFLWKGTGQWALVLTFVLVLGKTAGGFLMDRLTPRRASAISLLLSAALYLFCDAPLPGTAAVFLFNMTMPITLWAAAKVMPGAKGFAFGLLTFGLFIGYIPSWLGWPSLLNSPLAHAGMALLSLVLLWRPLGREEMKW